MEYVQMKRHKKYHRKKYTNAQMKRRTQRNIRLGLCLLIIILCVLSIMKITKPGLFTDKYYEKSGDKVEESRPDIEVDLLSVNPYSRPGIETGEIKGIVIHYTANPGSSAGENRDYFEGLKDSHITKASSNFVVGMEGEIVQCVPTWEVAYASNERNRDTVSIECCHPDESGEFTKETYKSVVELSAWLCRKFDLNEEDIIRHYDVTGKNCPKYYVENEEAWEQFRQDVREELKK